MSEMAETLGPTAQRLVRERDQRIAELENALRQIIDEDATDLYAYAVMVEIIARAVLGANPILP